ncbi:MAG: Hpt domain-containing protein [Candidatus Ozemobacteraceae bacterium]
MNTDDKMVPSPLLATADCSTRDFVVKLAYEKYMELTKLYQVLVKSNRHKDAVKVLVAIETAKNEYETELVAEKKRNKKMEKGNENILDHSQYLDVYIDVSRKNLDMMDKSLLELKQNPGNSEAVREICEAAKTLKGISATMGFEKVAHLTLEMGNILDKLRKSQLTVSSQIVDLFFETADVLRILMNDITSETDSKVDLEVISQKLNDALSLPNSLKKKRNHQNFTK